MTRTIYSGLILSLFALHGVSSAAEQRELDRASLAQVQSDLAGAANIKEPGAVGVRISQALGLGPNSTLLPLSSVALPNNAGMTTKYQQEVNGIPVWGQQVNVQLGPEGELKGIAGTAVFDAVDAPSPAPSITGAEALTRAKAVVSQRMIADERVFENETSDLMYYLQEDGKLRLTYKVSFFTNVQSDTGAAEPTRPIFFIDAMTGETIFRFENIQHVAKGKGPGGNTKTGKYIYGTGSFPAFGVLENSTKCSMDETNVFTENLNGGTSGTNTAYSFNCYENLVKEINGANSPLNDAQSFGQVVFDLYKGWYNTSPLTQKLQMRVHYSVNYQNAFWNGSSMTFGDGASIFYPLVSLDVSSHEVSHGFTEQNSGLIYAGQSGGINEAFSDMAGEASEYFYVQTYGKPFARQMPDFEVGADIFKAGGQALRYMCDPTRDGSSIGNAKDYVDGMDVHYSSGVYNKAYCLLAKTNGWDARKAFDVFVVANQHYWGPNSTFQTGAEGVVEAAKVLQYSVADVVEAFHQVGIEVGGAPEKYLFNTLRVITNSMPRGCGYANWDCMTKICKSDLQDSSAWRGWAGCWQKSGSFVCNFECSQVKRFF